MSARDLCAVRCQPPGQRSNRRLHGSRRADHRFPSLHDQTRRVLNSDTQSLRFNAWKRERGREWPNLSHASRSQRSRQRDPRGDVFNRGSYPRRLGAPEKKHGSEAHLPAGKQEGALALDRRCFLTGVAGFVGSAVIPDLVAAGHQVVGLARSRMLEMAGAEAHRCDTASSKAPGEGR